MPVERTNKTDWYTNLLSNTTELSFVSGHPRFSVLLNLQEDAPAAIRFIHKEETLIILLTIEVADLGRFNNGILGNSHVLRLKTLFGSSFHVLIYNGQDEFLLATPTDWHLRERNSAGFAEYIATIDPSLIETAGAHKAINRSQNDSFQAWTRTKLTGKCVVNDIDALLIGQGLACMVELKRVTADLGRWTPYIDDLANYKSFLYIAKRFEIRSRLIAYNLDQEKLVALHFQLQFSDDNARINGRYCLLEPGSTLSSVFGIPYSSSNSTRNYESLQGPSSRYR